MLDFSLMQTKQMTIQEISVGLTRLELIRLTDEMVDVMLAAMDGVTDADVVFIPQDPLAGDPYASDAREAKMAWTLGHVVVHATASSEESVAIAAALARGVDTIVRSRYEVSWRNVRSVSQLYQRLEESRRIRCAYLNAWPDDPHLDVTYVPWPGADEINAVGRVVLGLAHDDDHLVQMKEIIRQAKLAR